jgi:hypothetical protein
MANEAEPRGYDKDPDVLRVMKQQMISKFLQKDFESKLRVEDVPDADVAKYYKEHPEEFNRPEEVRVSQILVKDKAGATVRFKVDEVVTYPKDRFPTAAVYGPTPDVQLRLITCGGDFDEGRGHYRDNLIVYASVR